MPGFVKTKADEKKWAKAKKITKAQYPKLPKGRKYAVANTVFHQMKGRGGKRVERKGNPGTARVTEQFKHHPDKKTPFDVMDKNWQGDMLNAQKASGRHYSRGAAKQMTRKVPIQGGGEGKVIRRLKQSSLAGGR